MVDDDGIQQVDGSGNPINDAIVSVFVVIQPTVENTRRFEMGFISGSGTFRNYAAVLSQDVAGITDTFTFNLNQDEITPNTFYNFVAITENGHSIFIQDYDREIIGSDPLTEEPVLIRTEMFPIICERLEQDVRIVDYLSLSLCLSLSLSLYIYI